MDHAMIPRWNEYAGRDIAQWIPHGVDCQYFQPIKREKSAIKTIVFAGTHARDIQTLVNIVETLSVNVNLRFRFLSKHPDIVALGERLETVEVVPRLDDDGYRSLLQNADLLLLPLKMSTVCNVVLEALACGTPVVTTLGGIRAYLSPDSSTMLDSEDVHAWCTAVLDLLSRGDEARKQARFQAEKFQWTEIAKVHAKIYQSVMNG